MKGGAKRIWSPKILSPIVFTVLPPNFKIKESNNFDLWDLKELIVLNSFFWINL